MLFGNTYIIRFVFVIIWELFLLEKLLSLLKNVTNLPFFYINVSDISASMLWIYIVKQALKKLGEYKIAIVQTVPKKWFE